jgi:hypothetical protein
MNLEGSNVAKDLGAKTPACPVISTSFSGYEPPFNPAPIVQRMVESVPERYLLGLSEVVLTNASGLSRTRRRSVTKSRRRKVSVRDAGGLYHPAFNGKRAWIEIFVDNALRGWETGWWLRIPLIREGKIGDVLFHEIGHHIHFTCHPEYREREDVADVWKVRLQRQYIRHRFRWIATFGRLIRPLLGSFTSGLRAKFEMRMLRKGQISRAEYEESIRATKPGKTSLPH